MVLLGDVGQVEARYGLCLRVLISEQDRCTICAERTTGMEILFGATSGSAR
jgi:hypothetical protein